MAQRILISPDQMDGVANQFKQGAQQSQDLITRLNAQIEGMQGQWEGMTQQRFFQDFQQAKQTMRTFNETLLRIQTELNTIANRFRQADQQG
ncbi:WXG100 family type VII secretion target [Paenibacillus phyllosphaerae]|uniref:ESAT-6-like protein n=1 Tax=Paenibacillus phyllosphaerae TaxID=274593 RepID=A0A7W5FN74_9BACL|nr:WXG100 family type VII secretion target [Paenibacillus phyllosphaerae]MBB3110995.1 WXG100 family type VII secretion target [Paenibacillus phyllosphaerae]